ncbi:MAG: DUF58 domain-containing protein [Myxococcales bacterium]|nr:DUF58 domain-containing protein [Myxococcales bacterium]
MRPTPRALFVAAAGLGLAVLPALGLGAGWFGWALYWALFAAAFVVDASRTPRRRDLEIELDVPELLYVGAVGAGTLRLRSTGRGGRTEVTARVDVSHHLAPGPALRGILGEGTLALALPLGAERRGTAELAAAWVRVAGPLGLCARVHRVPLARTLAIVPNLPHVRGHALAVWGARDLEAGLKIERFLGDGSEFDSLREFMPGFDRRSVDWKASARHTKLLARQYRAERSHQIVLAVDTGRLMAEPLLGLPRLDHAVHAALQLGLVSVRAGDRVGLFAFDERPRRLLAPRAGMGAFRLMLAASSELAYSNAETNFTLGLTSLMASLSRRSLVIVLTDFVDTVSAELVFDNLLRLSRRHLCVFAALRDPVLDAEATREPARPRDLQRAIVADSLAQERELVLRRLARHGIGCIDAAPGELGSALCNRYLEIKRRELV